MRGIRAALSAGVFAVWVAIGVLAFRPGALSALDRSSPTRDSASCSSGHCTCSVSNSGCGCIGGSGGCAAWCTTGQSSGCDET